MNDSAIEAALGRIEAALGRAEKGAGRLQDLALRHADLKESVRRSLRDLDAVIGNSGK